jgi:hypothetical protein
MGKKERQAYLKAIRSRYWRAGKKAKETILDEFCAVCGYHRKYAIRLLNQRGKPRKKRRPGRKPVYASPTKTGSGRELRICFLLVPYNDADGTRM